MRYLLTALAALIPASALTADSDYTARMLKACLNAQTAHTRPQNAKREVIEAVNTCAVWYRIHKLAALEDGMTSQEIRLDYMLLLDMYTKQVQAR